MSERRASDLNAFASVQQVGVPAAQELEQAKSLKC
jgi:hypothetical protein